MKSILYISKSIISTTAMKTIYLHRQDVVSIEPGWCFGDAIIITTSVYSPHCTQKRSSEVKVDNLQNLIPILLQVSRPFLINLHVLKLKIPECTNASICAKTPSVL